MRPPRLARSLLRRLSPPTHWEEIDGDLMERFSATAATRGPGRAHVEYWRVVAAALAASVRDFAESWSHWRDLPAELRYSAARLRRAPGFALAVLLTLGLGVGANTLLFSAAHGLLVRPLPFEHADRVYWMFERDADTGDPSGVSGERGDQLAHSFSWTATAAIGDSALVRAVEGRHERWRGLWTTAGLFDVLSVRPLVGQWPRALPTAGSPRLMFISRSRWMRDFASDPLIVGRRLSFEDGKHFDIAGVLPDGLEFPFARVPLGGHGAGFVAGEQDFWTLAPSAPGAHPGGVMVGRLAPGESVESARAQMPAILFVSLRDQVLGRLGVALPLLLSGAGLVLLVAMGNVLNLALARAVAGTRDLTIRRALGAGPGDLRRLAAADACWLAAGGAVAALILVMAGRAWMHWVAPEHAALTSRVTLSAPVLLVMAATLAGIVALLMSVPALVRRQPGGGWQRWQRAFVALQSAMSVVLAAGALVSMVSLQRVLHADAGYEREHVIAVEPVLYIANSEARAIQHVVSERLLGLPGVEAVGFVHSTPLSGQWVIEEDVQWLDGPSTGTRGRASASFVGGDYFGAMRIPLLAGRLFEPGDFDRRDYPVIINDIAASRWFSGFSPLGARVRVNDRVREVVGVVKGTRDLSLEEPAAPQVYQPGVFGTSHMVVRSSGSTTARDIVAVIAAADSRFIIERAEPLSTLVDVRVFERRTAAQVLMACALVALAIAAVGLMGMVRLSLTMRRRELAVRVAIGAQATEIARVVLLHALSPVAVGAMGGVVTWWWVGRRVDHILYDVSARAPWVISSAVALLLGLAVLCVLPLARRAARIDPVAGLKG